jgi:hypothetical protein
MVSAGLSLGRAVGPWTVSVETTIAMAPRVLIRYVAFALAAATASRAMRASLLACLSH